MMYADRLKIEKGEKWSGSSNLFKYVSLNYNSIDSYQIFDSYFSARPEKSQQLQNNKAARN